MKHHTIADVTENEFLELVRKVCSGDYKTEYQHGQAIGEFQRLSEHPCGSDLIYYPKPNADDSPEGIVQEVKLWRAVNGKPGFKPESD